LTAKQGYTLQGVAANFFTVAGATATNAANNGEIKAEFPATVVVTTPINIPAIPGVTAPVTGGTPVKAITETAQYTGTVKWNGDPSVFAGGTAYIATIKLTAKQGYTLQGVAANFFTVAGATATNAANNGEIKAEFPATAAIFYSIDDLKKYLENQPANTDKTAYPVALNVSNLTGIANTLSSNSSKYVDLDLSGITTIPSSTFSSCASLASVTIPNSVTSIGDSAFANCTKLTSVTFSETSKVTSIGYQTFSSCTSLKSVTIPNSVTSIGTLAFYNCSSLASVTFAENSKVTSIWDSAFRDCKSLDSITIPNSVIDIGFSAFSECSILASVTFSETSKVTSIGQSAFSNCISLNSITIPDSVTNIGGYAFINCSNLTNVTIGKGVTIILYLAFFGCNNLTSVTFQGTISSSGVDSDTFNGLGDLRDKFYSINATNGTPGTYTRVPGGSVWTKQ
jgi:Flp pilus assembly protein protease CpaA